MDLLKKIVNIVSKKEKKTNNPFIDNVETNEEISNVDLNSYDDSVLTRFPKLVIDENTHDDDIKDVILPAVPNNSPEKSNATSLYESPIFLHKSRSEENLYFKPSVFRHNSWSCSLR